MNSKELHDIACFRLMLFDYVSKGFWAKMKFFGCVVEGWNKNERSGTVHGCLPLPVRPVSLGSHAVPAIFACVPLTCNFLF